MELLTILLSGVLTLVSSAGLVADTVAEKKIEEKLYAVEELQVRIDNTPSYQLVQGQVDRLRIAGRGLSLTPEMRIDTFELEMDPIDVNLENLQVDEPEQTIQGLRRPLLVAMRFVLTQEDINQALNSPEFADYLEILTLNLFNSATLQRAAYRYQIVNPRVEFLGNNRVRFETEIAERGYNDRLTLTVETGVELVVGRGLVSKPLRLISPEVRVNDRPAPGQFVKGLIAASDRFNLRRLEDNGIQSRLLQFNIDGDRVEMAMFVRVQPSQIASEIPGK
jgi:hypothetical protein